MAAQAPNPAELEWISDNLARLRSEGVDVHDPTALGAAFDRAYRDWSVFPPHLRDDPNEAINRIGIGAGEHLRIGAGLAWSIEADEHGAELALTGDPGSVLILPINLVATRWSDEGVGVLPELLATLIDAVTHQLGR